MTLKNYSDHFFFLALVTVSVAIFFIFKPFLTAILTAAILAIIAQKPYGFFLKITGNRKRISSILTSILVIFIVIILLFFFSKLVANEVNNLYDMVSNKEGIYQKYLEKIPDQFSDVSLLQLFNADSAANQEELFNSIKNISQGTLSLIQRTYQGIIGSVFWIFVVFFSLYYFLIDGKDIVDKFIYLSPLKDLHEKELIEKFVSISRATIKGTLIIAIIQGIIGGVIFALTGVSSPVVWGVLMIVLSTIPILGAGFIWFPAGAIMLLLGNIWQGVAILAVGIGIISVIDNLLRPKLVGRDTQMHPLLIFFSTIGGIMFFGIAGFMIGPVLMAFFVTLWEIYALESNS